VEYGNKLVFAVWTGYISRPG